MIFGQQLQFASEVIDARRRPQNFGVEPNNPQAKVDLASQYSRVIMQIIISLGILACCLYLLTTSKDANVQKSSTGFIGTVLGYWLR